MTTVTGRDPFATAFAHTMMARAYMAATACATRLSMTPKWRKRKRAQLAADLDRLCAASDSYRDVIGSKPGARSLRDILREQAGV